MSGKIISAPEALAQREKWRAAGEKVVFTNGVFDILHAGHVRSLAQAASCGDRLIIGLNTDHSVKKLKGPQRPIISEQDRAYLLAALFFVDAVVFFEDDTPLELITSLMPDVLVKSADYTIEQIAGAKEVLANGGKVELMPLVPGISSTTIIDKIRSAP
ncbi:rfaE bifunctional protein [Niabella soli DSM 19437]|uniref:D-glycero-beta-D-manno-heptose 1-phosphate adenylyltransferase n=1 Tax=Niabella soli DSM 19437 TaxID=929713 RepID=W0EUR9_9BACT|nr:rfaE bifunctional protein [Niabella soli DSM 19437]